MRKVLYILGALTLIFIVVAGAGIGVVVYKGNTLDKESRAFVDGAVPAIAGTWSQQELLDRATPELRETARLAQLGMVFETLSQLGPLVGYDGATGDASMSYMSGSGGTVAASYVAKARFRNGNATFHIGLVKRDGHWMIQTFHVDPGSRSGVGAERRI